jgi:hypothetical protein
MVQNDVRFYDRDDDDDEALILHGAEQWARLLMCMVDQQQHCKG